MKAATGELNLTVITLLAVAAIIGFFWAMWPTIRNSIGNSWVNISTKNEKNGETFNYG